MRWQIGALTYKFEILTLKRCPFAAPAASNPVKGAICLQDGFKDRLGRMMDEYGTGLTRLCTLMLRDRDAARDAVQDAFVKAYKALPGFRGECSEKTWLTAIAINVCRDYLRRRRIREVLFDKPPDIPCDAPFADDTVINEVMRLPDRLKSAVLVRYYENLTLEECARALGISRSGVKKRLAKAEGLLRDRLKEWYYG